MSDFVIRMRRGQPVQVDMQIIRWRKRRKRAQKNVEVFPDIMAENKTIVNVFGSQELESSAGLESEQLVRRKLF